MTSRSRIRAAFRRPLGFDVLEQRQLLAGNVTALLSGSHLLITGDTAANDLLIEPVANSAGRVVLTPVAGPGGQTSLNGQLRPLTFRSFGDIRLNLLGGDDTLEIAGVDTSTTDRLTGSLVIDGGRGDNTITVSNYNITGNLTVSTGTGDDTLLLDNVKVGSDIVVSNDRGTGLQTTNIQAGTTAGRDLLITSRGGDHDIDLGDSSSSGATGPVSIGRNLTILNSGPATEDLNINLHDVEIAANLAITNVAAATINIGTVTGTASVGHNTTIRNGSGDNSITVQNGSTLGTSAVDGVTILNGAGDDTLRFATSTLNAQVNVRNGSGDATVTASADAIFNADLGIINGNSGDHTVTIDSATVGTLTLFNGTGTSNSVVVGAAGNVAAGGRVTIANGAATGGNRIEITSATLSAGLSLVNGIASAGSNTVRLGATIAGAVTSAGDISINNGTGNSDIHLDNLTADGSVSISNGIAPTAHSLTVGETGPVTIEGNLTIYHRDGDSTTTINQAEVTGNLSIKTGAGDDDIVIAGTGASGVTVNGTTYVATGAGNDTLAIGNNTGTASLIDLLTVLMGTGTDTITLGAATDGTAGTALGDGLFNFDGGVDLLGVNTITIDGTVLDPFLDLITFNKFRNLAITVV